MNESLLDSAWRAETLVNREAELAKIRDAIYRSDRSCQIVLLRGPGGVGKTRLLEEMLWRAGHPAVRTKGTRPGVRQRREREDWTKLGNAVVSDLIDLTDPRFATRSQFLEAVRDSLDRPDGADFSVFDAAFLASQRARERGADYASVLTTAQKAEQKFLEEYRRNAREKRIVLVLDTVEHLALLPTSKWLLDQGILKAKDLFFSTSEWLLTQIGSRTFENTTLIIAGRDAESDGGPFFAAVRQSVLQSAFPTVAVDLPLEPFSAEDTRQYFSFLADDWQDRRNQAIAEKREPLYDPARRQDWQDRRNQAIAETMRWLAKDPERAEVLHLYTGGKPVLLSLYAALVFERPDIPRLLTLPLEEARAYVQEHGSRKVQAEIELEFVKLLFAQPGLRSAILQALVRARRGLDAEQLHYVLDSAPGVEPGAWVLDNDRLRDIQTQLTREQLSSLSIVKARADGRVGLQDEIYRIYAERMGEQERNRDDERAARQLMYKKLLLWAEHQQHLFEAERRGYQEGDERGLQISSPARALSAVFPLASDLQLAERSRVHRRIQALELDRMHYAILMDPDRNLNNVYFDLAERRWMANDEDADFTTQAEMWRAIRDDFAMRFADISPERIKTLRYAADHDDAARWIKRFILRGDFRGAISFFDAVEDAIRGILDSDEKRRWQHTLGHSERAIWRYYAQIMSGDDVASAVRHLLYHVDEAVKLASHDVDTVVFPERWDGEKGFRASRSHPAHPALGRLHRVIAVGFNFAGYGCAVLGQFGMATKYYGEALYYMRETDFVGQQAATRNNLGRTLSESGRNQRGRRLVVDALELRRRQGTEIPIAYSINTLALIDNDTRRPDLAWREAAKAVAYFRRAEMNRGLGLALIELSKGLRRLANQEQPGLILEDPPDRIYAEAERAAQEAIVVFQESTANAESPRLIEAWIEMGCVKRDQIRALLQQRVERLANRYAADAVNFYSRAKEGAFKRNLTRLALDAIVNTAWAYYYAGDTESARRSNQEADALIEDDYRLRIGQQPPDPGKDKSYMYYQLSKLHNLQGQIAMEQFRRRAEIIRQEIAASGHEDRKARQKAVHLDEEARASLRAAAEAFVQALCYAELLSPRSPALTLAYHQIYDHLKEFNSTELEDFRRYQRAARRKYQVNKIRIEDFSDLDRWIEDCFGPE